MLRRCAFVFAVLLLSSCGGEESSATTEPVAEPDVVAEADSVSEAATQESGEISPLTSVPIAELGASHIEPPVSFSHSPSIGGDHYAFWQNCGFYNVEVIEGAATHTMEHGAIWITYNADRVSSDELTLLENLASENPRLLISPYPHEDKLVLSAWGVQQRMDVSPDAPEVQQFIAEWQDNPELIEAGVTCVDAVGVPPSNPELYGDGDTIPAEYLG